MIYFFLSHHLEKRSLLDWQHSLYFFQPESNGGHHCYDTTFVRKFSQDGLTAVAKYRKIYSQWWLKAHLLWLKLSPSLSLIFFSAPWHPVPTGDRCRQRLRVLSAAGCWHRQRRRRRGDRRGLAAGCRMRRRERWLRRRMEIFAITGQFALNKATKTCRCV